MPRHVYQVSSLIAEINEVLEPYRDLYVEGEVTNLTRAGSGHLYFTIKDSKSQLHVVMFAMQGRSLRFRIENGLKLILRGRLKIYEGTGKFQLVADSAEPAGVGALQLAFEQLKARLAAEGLFEQSRKKAIPMLPQRIAIITSPTGAAVRDILHVLGRRFAGLSIQIYPVRVQGAFAAREVTEALQRLSEWEMHDVILICRGGGSLEDLWPFNEESVARAVAACPVPTISGIGHETDFTICDFVADLRAPTPSAAAEIVVRAKAEIGEQINQAVRRIRTVLDRSVSHYRSELRHISSAEGLGRFPRRVERQRERLQRRRVALFHLLDGQAKLLRRRLTRLSDPIARFPDRLAIAARKQHALATRERLARALEGRLQRKRQVLRSAVATLQAVSPLSVLSRGYAIAFNRRHKPILDAGTVSIGDPVQVQLKKGSLNCTVDSKTMGVESIWPPVGFEE
ncbi:MAG TPA: exodeoxyribonuclease VII large subunit [Thermoanaerobaculia bacterium]|nr:exodeoxyribonuclease VII large subunit [Thermoanaerobaculia bacterium]